MEEHKKQIDTLSKNKIMIYESDNFHLDYIVQLYHNGEKWIMIPFELSVKYPIIYDNINGEDITIFTCPFSYYTAIYIGIYKPSKYKYENTLVLETNGQLFKINEIKNKKTITIKTYRDALRENIDFGVMKVKDDDNNNDKINKETQKEIKKNMRNLGRIIEYFSSENLQTKYTIIKTGPSTKKFNKYISYYDDKLKEKNSFISSIIVDKIKKNTDLFPNYTILDI
jgi:hypothetical protein